MNETRTSQPTPEQLVKLLEVQLASARSKRSRTNTTPRRAALLVGAVLIIVGGGCVALLVLQQMLSDLRQHPPASGPQLEESAGQSGNF